MIAAIKVSMDLNDKSQILCTAQKNGIVNLRQQELHHAARSRRL